MIEVAFDCPKCRCPLRGGPGSTVQCYDCGWRPTAPQPAPGYEDIIAAATRKAAASKFAMAE